MKLSARIQELEARLPKPDREPFSYGSYIELSKSLSFPCHENMGPMMIGSALNLDRTKNVPTPEHCLSREQYEALVWSNAEKCASWIIDRCELHDVKSVCLFMDGRVSGETIGTKQQRQALSTIFDGLNLTTIPVHHEILTTDFLCGVIEAVGVMRSQKRITEEAQKTAEWQEWLDHRRGENPLHREANERARQHRIGAAGSEPVN